MRPSEILRRVFAAAMMLLVSLPLTFTAQESVKSDEKKDDS